MQIALLLMVYAVSLLCRRLNNLEDDSPGSVVELLRTKVNS